MFPSALSLTTFDAEGETHFSNSRTGLAHLSYPVSAFLQQSTASLPHCGEAAGSSVLAGHDPRASMFSGMFPAAPATAFYSSPVTQQATAGMALCADSNGGFFLTSTLYPCTASLEWPHSYYIPSMTAAMPHPLPIMNAATTFGATGYSTAASLHSLPASVGDGRALMVSFPSQTDCSPSAGCNASSNSSESLDDFKHLQQSAYSASSALSSAAGGGKEFAQYQTSHQLQSQWGEEGCGRIPLTALSLVNGSNANNVLRSAVAAAHGVPSLCQSSDRNMSAAHDGEFPMRKNHQLHWDKPSAQHQYRFLPLASDCGKTGSTLLSQHQQRRKTVYSNNILYKTVICNDHQPSVGKFCPRGASCQFAHGVEDVHIPTGHQLYHTKMCAELLTNGKCSRGVRCYHAHNIDELRAKTAASQGCVGTGVCSTQPAVC